MSDEGYLVLATGPERYIDMARNLAASLRVMDGTRPICLVHDENARLAASDARFFDDTAVLEDHPLYPGFMNKIRLYQASPYPRAMFVDADCLLMKRDIDRYWAHTRPLFFAITGERATRGEWKGADIAHLIGLVGAPYLVRMNSGVFCFDRSDAAAAFFGGLNDFYLANRGKLGVGLHRGRPTQTDEIYIGLWMGLNGLDSCGGKRGAETWMVSTWRAFGMRFDPERSISLLNKPRHAILGVPNPIGGWDRLSPSFVHFIGLKPESHYRRLCEYFLARLPDLRVSGGI